MAGEEELTEKENLFLADAAALLSQPPAPEVRSPSREEDDKDLRRRQQSLGFLSWQKGQLTQNLRRRSEQTLVAAADLRELTAAVHRDAAAAATEEAALVAAEEELAAARTQCLHDIQNLWDSLDDRERRLELEAEQVLAAAAKARRSADSLVGAGSLATAVCDQAGDLQEESALLVDLHEDLETRDVSLQCQEAAFGCLVSGAEAASTRERALAALREGVAEELAAALGGARQESPSSLKEAILSSIAPSWGDSEGAPPPPELPRVHVDPRIFSRPSSLASRSLPRREEDYDLEDEDGRDLDHIWDDDATKELDVYEDHPDGDLPPEDGWADEEVLHGEEHAEVDYSPADDWMGEGEDMLDGEDEEFEEEEEEELEHEEDFEQEGEPLLSPQSATGPADSPNSALPSDSTFIGFPVPAATAEAPAVSPVSGQVNRSSFPVATALTPQRLTFAPTAAQSQPAPFPVPVWAQTTTIRPRAQVVSQPGAATVPVQFMRLNPQRGA